MKKAKVQGALTLVRGVMRYKKGFYKYASSKKKDREKCRCTGEWRRQQWTTWKRPKNSMPFVHHSSQEETSSCMSTVGKERDTQFCVCSK